MVAAVAECYHGYCLTTSTESARTARVQPPVFFRQKADGNEAVTLGAHKAELSLRSRAQRSEILRSRASERKDTRTFNDQFARPHNTG